MIRSFRFLLRVANVSHSDYVHCILSYYSISKTYGAIYEKSNDLSL